MMPTRFRRWVNAFNYSWQGLREAFCSEKAFQEETILLIIAVPTAIILPVSLGITIALIASILLVMIVELLNSAIEAVVDRVSLEKHPLSKKAKDLGSSAVLIAILNVLIVWGGVIIGMFTGL